MKLDDIEIAFAAKGTPILWLSPQCEHFSYRPRRFLRLRKFLFGAVLVEARP